MFEVYSYLFFKNEFMRFYLLLIIFTLPAFCLGQDRNVVVTYGLVFYDDELFNVSENPFKRHLDYAINNPNRFIFDLKINSKGSSFELKNHLSLEEKSLSDDLSFVFAQYYGVVFSVSNSILTPNPLIGNNVFVKTAALNDWELTNETKEIDGHLCYKATRFNVVVRELRTFKHPVIAWYCPEISYNHGPLGYGNLPGLILQLQIRNVVYGALKIDLESDDKPNFNILKKSEIITEGEKSVRFKKLYDN